VDGIFARACEAEQTTDIRPEGTSFCITPEPDGHCRSGFKIQREFTTRGADHRTCSPCECDPPRGGSCAALVTLYGDTSCASPFDSTTLSDTDAPRCHDITAGAELTAFRVQVVQQQNGTCTPKRAQSVVYGTIEEVEHHVVCCHD
jgi:hypothetical protein